MLPSVVEAVLADARRPLGGPERAVVKSVAQDAYLGFDTTGWAFLLLRDQQEGVSPVRLDSFEVDPWGAWRVDSADGDPADSLHGVAIRCDVERSDGLMRAFSIVAAALIQGVSADDPFVLAETLVGFQELFALPGRQASFNEVVGLWGELMTIISASQPAALARAWRQDPGATFDFALSNARLEVKTSLSAARTHWFALSQKRAAAWSDVAVLSVVVSALERGGVGVEALARRVVDAVAVDDPILAANVYSAALKTLGGPLPDSPRFDEASARASLRVVAFASVPAIDAPSAVVDARWQVALAGLPELFAAESVQHPLVALLSGPTGKT